MEKILIVEDEKNIVELLKYNLEKNDYSTDYAYDGEEGLNLFKNNKYDLILLDLMLPKITGLELCEKMKEINSEIPIIMLTAKSRETDKIEGLNIGADDYITKPFSINEVLARINALLRRVNRKNKNNKEIYGELEIDYKKYEVKIRDNIIELTLKEFELLKLLIDNKENPVSRDEILEKVWGYKFVGETRTVDVHIRNLRSKIEEDDSNPEYIKTVRGIGYKFGIE